MKWEDVGGDVPNGSSHLVSSLNQGEVVSSSGDGSWIISEVEGDRPSTRTGTTWFSVSCRRLVPLVPGTEGAGGEGSRVTVDKIYHHISDNCEIYSSFRVSK